ncbi:hypothetical protein GCM10020216_095070 [Nonomuraea helvata]
MPSVTPEDPAINGVAGGVDTHQDTHTAAVIDTVGRVLGSEQFTATSTGYAVLLTWMQSFGTVTVVGIDRVRTGLADLQWTGVVVDGPGHGSASLPQLRPSST